MGYGILFILLKADYNGKGKCMSDSFFKIVYQNGTGEIIEKKSRFIATVYHIETEEDVSTYISATRKKYWDAKHNCYAFVLGNNNEIQRCSDDGEPAGTAGKPILEVIQGNEIHNCLIIVTRYFGGVLLGTGGLVRAYQQASKAGLENSVITQKMPGNKIKVDTDYNGLGKIQYIAGQMNLAIVDVEYTDAVSITMVISIDAAKEFEEKVTEVTAGKARIQTVGEQYFGYDNGNIILF